MLNDGVTISHSVTRPWRELWKPSEVSDIDPKPDKVGKAASQTSPMFPQASVSSLAGRLCTPRAFRGTSIAILLYKHAWGKQSSMNGEGSFLTCIIFFTKMIKKQNKRKILKAHFYIKGFHKM